MVAMGMLARALGALLVAITLADAGGGGARCPSAGLPAQGCSAAAAAAGGAEAALASPRQAVPHPTAAQTDGRGAGNGSPILFILADDQGWSDLSSTGSTYYESPNIDSIAAQGMMFTRGYANSRVCSPSRASIMTGKYTPRHGITSWIGDPAGEKWRDMGRHDSHLPASYEMGLKPDDLTLAEVLLAAGYRTFYAGKWHLGPDPPRAFEVNKGGHHVGSPPGGYFSPYKNPALDDGPPGESLPLRLGRETASFIAANADNPFFAVLAFYSVHSPIQTTKPLWDKYRAKASGLVPANASRFVWDRRLAVRQVQDNPIYAGMVEAMDTGVGYALDALEAAGLSERAIVIYTSDNGGVSSGDAFSTSNLPLRGGKGRQWEGGYRVPYFIKAPSIATPGSRSDVAVSGIDFFPTLLELVGIATPGATPPRLVARTVSGPVDVWPTEGLDGVSLVPLLRGGALPAERSFFAHEPHYGNQGGEPASHCLRGDLKLILYHEDGREELYNIRNDVGEARDLAGNAAYASDLRQLREALQAWLADTGARMPSPDPLWDRGARRERFEVARTTGAAQLEAQHAGFLAPAFEPNRDWWGSDPAPNAARL